MGGDEAERQPAQPVIVSSARAVEAEARKPEPVSISISLSAVSGVADTGAPAMISDEITGVERPSRPQAPLAVPQLPDEQTRLLEVEEIARGGMATIHKVFDRNIRRHVALKRVDAALAAEAPDAAHLLVEEAQITGQLAHPNIVPVYDLGLGADGAPMFTMKLVRGRTMTQLILASDKRGHTHAQLRLLLEAMLRVCDALSFAHARGVIHRDLKPDNIMIGDHGQVYVMDWGCALLLGEKHLVLEDGEPPVSVPETQSRRSAENTLLGTAAYMSPEQAWGAVDEIDGRTDVFALGAVLYQILTRRPPYRSKSFIEAVRMAQAGQITPPEQACPGVEIPPGLAAIAMKAMSLEPGQRYQSANEMRQALARFLGGVSWFPQRRYQPGEVIVREGEAGDSVFIIDAGACEASRELRGVRKVLRRMVAGEVFGETAILTSQPRSATVTAVDEVLVTVIAREALEQELGAGSWVGTILRTLAGRFREIERRLEQQGRVVAFTRVIEAVRVHLSMSAGEACWSQLCAALADALGLSEEMVTQAVLGSADLTIDETNDVIRARAAGPGG